MKNIVILSGAGMSAESGISTFRDAGGLWEGHDIMEVASPEGWRKNPELVTEFYNKRRLQLAEVEPNAGHLALKLLEAENQVTIITQNVDDLHERAGSNTIVHLHGELTKMRSSEYENDIYEVGYEAISYGTLCSKGTLLRPHIVWFGEAVPMIDKAIDMISNAQVLIIVGTSLEVYPAAGLMHYAPTDCLIYLIDPNRHQNLNNSRIELIKDTAANALPKLVTELISKS
ncbi:MAG: NAD-dependent deacylase [bacterium]|nr:NAD-dependent deacylase [bacterium]